MKIRNEQMEALEVQQEEIFITHEVPHLRAFAPEIVADSSDDELRAFVRSGLERAAKYRINTWSLLEQYIEFMTWLGERFDVDPDLPWAGRLLNHKHLSPRQKIDRLEDYILSEWEGAR